MADARENNQNSEFDPLASATTSIMVTTTPPNDNDDGEMWSRHSHKKNKDMKEKKKKTGKKGNVEDEGVEVAEEQASGQHQATTSRDTRKPPGRRPRRHAKPRNAADRSRSEREEDGIEERSEEEANGNPNVPPPTTTAGAYAINPNRIVPRGRHVDDNMTQVSDFQTVSTDDSMPPPPQHVSHDAAVPIAAQVVHPTENVEEMREEMDRLRAQVNGLLRSSQTSAPLVHAEAAQVMALPPEEDGGDSLEGGGDVVDTNEAANVGMRKCSRRRFIVFGAIVLVVIAVVATAVGLSSSSSSNGSGPVDKNPNINDKTVPATSVPSAPPPNMNDTPVPATSVPTASPVLLPTLPPTSPPTRHPTLPPTRLPTQVPTPSPTIYPMLPNGPWLQRGQELEGKNERDLFGYSISLSRDGNVLAATGGGEDGNVAYVSVFQLNPTSQSWTPMGQELVGEVNEEPLLEVNGNGNILLVGEERGDVAGNKSGYVRAFEYNPNTERWVQLGSDIEVDYYDPFPSRSSMSLSDSGDTVAIGSTKNDGEYFGLVRIFRYIRNISSWEQYGQTLTGETELDGFGASVSLNSFGTILAVGARNYGYSDVGQVYVYKYIPALSKWAPMGTPISGHVVNEKKFGYSVSLDDSGLILAVGTIFGSQTVSVFSFDNATLEWTQQGQTLRRRSGFPYPYLSGNGNVLAVVYRWLYVNGTGSGQAFIFQYNVIMDEWIQMGDPVSGGFYDSFGYSASLSANGTVLGFGAPTADPNMTGKAYVFSLY